ncbi:hypothetical protein EHO98_03040 [Leptospira stimsonii]|uniref:Uncharacterized protein n=1 Tax=Leptospira stimsonii TaxID=2202203 RepID=A0ABY2MVG6_9LEPT|nr:hypothetical protein EHO98_03040 [Leptospira stimsonii]TGM08833.1 hypothetical protein EHQ90_22225 [Leptospira stimsonii]
MIFQNNSVTIDHSPDETKIPRFRIQIREPDGNFFFSISESKFLLLAKAILEKSGVEVKEESKSDLGSLEVD